MGVPRSNSSSASTRSTSEREDRAPRGSPGDGDGKRRQLLITAEDNEEDTDGVTDILPGRVGRVLEAMQGPSTTRKASVVAR